MSMKSKLAHSSGVLPLLARCNTASVGSFQCNRLCTTTMRSHQHESKQQQQNVIHFKSLLRRTLYILILMIIISVQSNRCQQQLDDASPRVQLAVNNSNDDDERQLYVVRRRAKRTAEQQGNRNSDQQLPINIRQQQQQIPAANPNFEAAFQGECGKNNNSNPCEHICLDLHDGTYECSCFYGFTLAVDGYSCAHIAPPAAPPLPPPTSSLPQLATAKADYSIAAAQHRSSQAAKLASASKAAPEPHRQTAISRREEEEEGFESVDGGDPPGASTASGSSSTDNDISGVAAAARSGRGHDSQQGSNWIEQSANDNRKLADEFARGAASRAGGPPARLVGGDNARARASGTPPAATRNNGSSEAAAASSALAGGRRQSMELLEAVARIRRQQQQGAKLGHALASGAGSGSHSEDKKEVGISNNNNNNSGGCNYPKCRPSTRFEGKDSANRITQPQPELQWQSFEANTVALLESRPQTTTSAIAGNGRAIIIDGAAGPVVGGPHKGILRARQRLSYEIDDDDGGRDLSVNTRDPLANDYAAGRFVELNFGGGAAADDNGDDDDDEEFLDPEVRSIMISNDKLVAALSSSVASLEAEIEPEKEGGSGLQTDRLSVGDEHGNNNKLQMGRRITSKASDMDKRGAVESAAMGNRQDYAMNLLVNLVKRTMIEVDEKENYSRFDNDDNDGQRNPVPVEQSTEGRELVQYNDHAEINEPSPMISMGLDQSYEPMEPPHRDRRKAHHSSSGSRSLAGGDIIIDRRQIHAAAVTATNANKNTPQFLQQRQPALVAIAESNYDNGGGVLCRDHENELTKVFRDCIEMSECESGGRCFKETAWISSRNSDLAQLEARARCRCPIGRGGHLCQIPQQRSTPKFMGHSYLALPTITEPFITSLRLVFKPERRLGVVQRQGSLLLQSQKFLLILDDMQRVELRYSTSSSSTLDEKLIKANSTSTDHRNSNLSKITRVIGSQDAELDKWNELIVTDVLSDNGMMKSTPLDDRIVLVTPEKIHLNDQVAGELFVAGYPDLAKSEQQQITDKTSSKQHSVLLDDKSIGGFTGCIRELSINGRQYNFRSDLEGDALDGFDVVECC